MRIDEIISQSEEPVFSFEFFPPASEEGERNLREAIEKLAPLEPSFVSITRRAASTGERTVELTRWMKQELGLEAMSHLTGYGSTLEELRATLDCIGEAGIENVLALRGDSPSEQPGWTAENEAIHYASELIELIAREYSFCVGAACYPEVHVEASDLTSEIRVLRAKAEAGAGFFVTQLFFDNDVYFEFVEAARAAGIEQPIIPGLMPITNIEQIERMTALSGASIPAELMARIFEYGVSGVQEDDAASEAVAPQRGQGLFVAKTYMAKMGGTIAAENVDEIIDEHLVGGRPVERLRITPDGEWASTVLT